MTIFLALSPQSVCNGAVKIETLKQLEIDLLNVVNDSGYLSNGSAPKIGHRLFLVVSLHTTHSSQGLIWAERNLETESLYHVNAIKYIQLVLKMCEW